MKKIKLMLVAFMAMIGTVAFAQQMTDGKLKFYGTEADGVWITGFVTSVTDANKADLVIPATITNITEDESPSYKVVGVVGEAFKGETAIQKVTFTANLTEIGTSAFEGCTALKTVDFTAATKLASIYQNAFKGTIIETLDLSTTAVVNIFNLFGTTPKHDQVLWEAGTDLDDANGLIAIALGCGMAEYGVDATADQANAWNRTLTGALVFDALGENKFTADQAAAFNLAVLGGKKAGAALTADEAKAYNTKLDGAFNYNDEENVDGGKFTLIGIAKYKTYVDDTSLKNDGDEFEDDEKEASDTYNASLDGAFAKTGVASLTAEQAAAYNAKLDAAKKAGDTFTETEANTYNATLTGKITTGYTWIAEDATTEGIKASVFNKTVGFKAVGDERYAAVTAVANDKLQTVKLPATWTTFVNSVYGATTAGVFENCTKLATIDFGTAATATTQQYLSERAFVNTGLTALNFTGTKIKGQLPANLLIDGVDTKKNETLQTVTLNGKDFINDLNKNFAFCTKLSAIDLTNVTIAANEFEGAGLTAVTIPATYTKIPAAAFKDCTKLAEVNFAPVAEGGTWVFNEIAEYAFANTALTSFTVPNVLPFATLLAGNPRVADNAFADCAKLTSFTYKPKDVDKTAVVKVISDKVFLGCEDGITFYTLAGYAEAATVGKDNAPTHSTFSYDASPATDPTEVTELTANKFKNGNNKYFLKYNHSLLVTEESPSLKNIKIAKANAKVYAAYNADDDATIVMQQFKTKDGYYHIAAGDNVMIISDAEKIPYEISSYNGSTDTDTNGKIEGDEAGKGSSWLVNASATFVNRQDQNMLQYISDKDGIKRSYLEGVMPAGYNIFAWSNTTSATGWLKITSGSTFPQKTMYIFAKPTATAEGARVIWLDENGFVEDETTAIQSISTQSENEDGAIYNVAGQKVNASYKGLVIKNGKKYMK